MNGMGEGVTSLPPLSVVRRIDVICNRYEERWKSGARPRIEDYLREMVEPGRSALLKELLALDLALLDGSSLRSSPEEYRQRFPEYAPLVDAVFAETTTSDPQGEDPPTAAYAGADCADTRADPARSATDRDELVPGVGEGNGAGPDTLRPGQRLGDYELLDRLGGGGMGVVFRARQGSADRIVAIKLIKPDWFGELAPESKDEVVERFLAEARATARLEHEHIVAVYEVGRVEGRHFYSMRFIEGQSLSEMLRKAPVSNLQAAAYLEPVANAVEFAHARGILHRDIKPANILIDAAGRPYVVDFGLAKLLEKAPNLTRTGDHLGTPSYMAPEQARDPSRASIASDVYSLGVTLYELLVGRPPFQAADPWETIRQVICEEPLPPRRINPAIARDLETICLKCLAKAPSRRYHTAQELADDLHRWRNGEPIKARPIRIPERVIRWGRRRPVLAVAAVAGLILCFGLASNYRQWRSLVAAQRSRALDRINTLISAVPESVPTIIDGLEPFREEVAPRLRQMVRDPDLRPNERARVRLALLPEDNRQVSPLMEHLLVEASPKEVRIIRQALAPHGATLKDDLWQRLGARPGDRDFVLRAACALALFDPRGPRWSEIRRDVALMLVSQDPLSLGEWSEMHLPVRDHLLAPLTAILREPDGSDRPYNAASLLALYFGDRPELLVGLLQDADARQAGQLARGMRQHRDRVIGRLIGLATTPSTSASSTEGEDRLARFSANAAIALFTLEKPEDACRLLKRSSSPQARAYLIHSMKDAEISATVLLAGLEGTNDDGILQALILALGQLEEVRLPISQRTSLLARFATLYRRNGDAGVHSSVDWLVRRWGQSERIDSIDRELAGAEPPAGHLWYTGPEGHTMSILPVPASPRAGARGGAGAGQGKAATITRPFAIATKETTFEQYLRSDPVRAFQPPPTGRPRHPATPLTIYEAMKYCRWLSERAGIAEDQMCYPPAGKIGPDLVLDEGHLSRTGFRLPTETEWEYACRSGTVTSRFYGDDQGMLRYYARSLENSDDHTWEVGGLEPNDFGLFDVYGNVAEWCADRVAVEPPRAQERDRRAPVDVIGAYVNVVRGGSCILRPQALRSTKRVPTFAEATLHYNGLRVARTLPTSPVVNGKVSLDSVTVGEGAHPGIR